MHKNSKIEKQNVVGQDTNQWSNAIICLKEQGLT